MYTYACRYEYVGTYVYVFMNGFGLGLNFNAAAGKVIVNFVPLPI
ncbi:MAG TPA: hypothetical protein VK209_07040 [Candidatus Sulfotelmatobacter sp.]|nr:hypothetical protein [Candidatus Sulfotelmatobacter sp.]